MEQLDLAFRSAGIALLGLFAIITLRSKADLERRLIGSAFYISVAAYLICSSQFAAQLPRTVHEAIELICPLPPPLFYIWSRSMFDDRFRLSWSDGALIGLVMLLYGGGQIPGMEQQPWLLARSLVGLVLVVVALVRIGAGLRQDLVERRRNLRAVVLILSGAYVGGVVIVEIFFGFQSPGHLVDTLNAAGILAVIMVIASLSTTLTHDLAGPRPDVRKGKSENLSPQEQSLLEALNRFVEAQDFRTEGLTLSRVAEELDAQDYRLRRLINGHLGYRNFNDFLNTYRVEAAKADLRDPEKTHLPILTIAMDLGYRSLASFNRAFKELTGSTPSEFRQNAPLGGESAGSSRKS